MAKNDLWDQSRGEIVSPRSDNSLPGELAGVLHRMLQQRDPYTAGHMYRVEWLSVSIARKLGMGENTIEGLRLGARLHDIGKFSIPFEILNRPGRLSGPELGLIRQHARNGYDIVNRFSWPWPVPEMLLQHHERIDGNGYPLGVGGKDILPEAKIIAVADSTEAMESHRPYRPAMSRQVVSETLRNGRGTMWDRNVVDACLELLTNPSFQLPVEKADNIQTHDRS